jgi:uncharacterized Zn finger protein (UPF0148 family)
MLIRLCEACGLSFVVETDELLCPTCNSTIDELTEAQLEQEHFEDWWPT